MVDICRSSTIPSVFPDPGAPLECLAASYIPEYDPPEYLQEVSNQTVVFSANVGAFSLNCTLDENLNPNKDCFYTIAYFCDPIKLAQGSSAVSNCKSNVDSMFKEMNIHLRAWRYFCGKWIWSYDSTFSPEITDCPGAINNTLTNTEITSEVIYSANSYLWNSVYLLS